MYSTLREILVEIENQIQQITANRHDTIPEQRIEMVLNKAAIKVINDKYNNKSNYKREGLEQSTKRVDDFKSLKRQVIREVIKDDEYPNRGYIFLPEDYLHFESSSSYVKYSKFDKSIFNSIPKTYRCNGIELVQFTQNSYDSGTILRVTNENGIVYDFDKIFYQDPYGIINQDNFEFINILIDQLHQQGFSCYYDSVKEMIISSELQGMMINTIGTVDSGEYEPFYTEFEYFDTYDVLIKPDDRKIKQNDLVSTEELRDVLDNYYSGKNRHNNPVIELRENKLYVYYGDNFAVSEIYLNYIKKPKIFSIAIDQISDIDFIDDVIEQTVADLLLEIKDNAYQAVKQNQLTN